MMHIEGFDAAWLVIIKGGPVMWPLLICSLLSVTITIERLLFWWRQRMSAHREELLDMLLQRTECGEFDQAIQIARRHPFAATRILAAGLKHHAYGLEGSLEVAAGDEIARMKYGLTALDTVITLAPLLGILGTVMGIIHSFRILEAVEIQDPSAVISGLAEALITTAVGLIIAMVTLVPYNVLVSKIQREARRLEQIIAQFEVAYKKGLEYADNHRLRKPEGAH
ncbi:MAG: MotA/TolQ/ExbB proton channel family protein [Verrucomicrobia bacterium]|nr:MotA/TolQ/ExbB proton channel family protein [Verrucomicrobiota bacterium]MBU1734458.1 MotA/TolQ/ExbB proton channel family protein [Verrucomicrobiota bacterium]MBU1856078.1 MotA/TolQ/ExbB proton channel family protein [Verrucomicrobiota bacterium]